MPRGGITQRSVTGIEGGVLHTSCMGNHVMDLWIGSDSGELYEGSNVRELAMNTWT